MEWIFHITYSDTNNKIKQKILTNIYNILLFKFSRLIRQKGVIQIKCYTADTKLI